MIVDNADNSHIFLGAEQSKGTVNCLLEDEEGVAVYTTRTLEVAVSLTPAHMLHIGALDRQDARNFLLKLAVRQELLSN